MVFARCATTALAAVGLAAGCATVGGPSRRSDEAKVGASASAVVTAQELGRLMTQGSLMDALVRLRPYMLSARGTKPLVSVDGSPLAELSLLQMIPASTVREVRLLRSSSSVGHATIAPNGDVIVGDVIVVTTWQGSRGAP
jgi:hypothetical protein